MLSLTLLVKINTVLRYAPAGLKCSSGTAATHAALQVESSAVNLQHNPSLPVFAGGLSVAALSLQQRAVSAAIPSG